jgi:phospholipid/cholesterol/gamma-HCH transport system substrate-binding protein
MKINREFKIGLAGIAALFILIYGINFLKGINLFKPATYYYVKFADVNGLAKSSPVYADGVRVGIVRNINYDYAQSGNVTVEVEVDNDLRIPMGSSAELVSELMGGVRMNLLLANNPRARYQVGDTITGDLNKGLMDGVADMMPQIAAIIPKLDTLISSLATIASDKNIPATLESLQKTTANLEVASNQLSVVMKKDIPQLTGKLNTLSDNFIAISDNLKETDYNALLQKVDQTLANVKSITDKMNNPNNNIGLLFNDTKLYDNLNSTANNAANLLEDLKTNPKRYVHFSLFGKKNN